VRFTSATAVLWVAFALLFVSSFGFDFGVGCATRGGVNVARVAVVEPTELPGLGRPDVEALLVDGEVLTPDEGSGAAPAVPFESDARGVVADVPETGASGVGTAWADSAIRFAFGAGVVTVPPEGSTVAARYVAGGSSGPGMGVPPAAEPVAGQASTTRHAPVPSAPPLRRRDVVHADIPSLPFGPHRTCDVACMSTGMRGGRRMHPAAARADD
jgi:hypothetical protein